MNDESLTPDSVNYCFVSNNIVIANFHVREEFRNAGAVDVMAPKWEDMAEVFESNPTIIKTEAPVKTGWLWDGAEFTAPGDPA
jgi:hypothetical protein